MNDGFRCIYCRDWKNREEFNREHILHDSVTKGFDDYCLHDRVCKLCNTDFGNFIDRIFGRSGPQGVRRFDYGMKSLKEFDQFRPGELTISMEHRQPLYQNAQLQQTIKGDERVVNYVEQIVLERVGKDPICLNKDELQAYDLSDFLAKREFSGRFLPIGETDDLRNIFYERLLDHGATWEDDDSVPDSDGQSFGTFSICEPQLRAVAKIAFNYFAEITKRSAWHQVFFPYFDSIRTYIKHGNHLDRSMKVGFVQSAAIPPWIGDINLREGHFVGIDAVRMTGEQYYLAVIVSLFQEFVYIVYLSWDYKGPTDIASGHCWHFDTKKQSAIHKPALKEFIRYARTQAASSS